VLWALLSVQVVEVAGLDGLTVGGATGYSAEPVGSTTDELDTVE